ncbi:unnamed protein product [Eruca vesicaria subsp. sativa]|uniref:Uncharacterized protein n=1 Tax=Eruca vesicaria subsp. sativa TaxID=29727 RepID=A0ABC8LQQ9_ERUVS|nr:unnamed protein product [Eruca vesicaria subsp. sativa]
MNSHGEPSCDQLYHSNRNVMQQRHQDMVNRETVLHAPPRSIFGSGSAPSREHQAPIFEPPPQERARPTHPIISPQPPQLRQGSASQSFRRREGITRINRLLLV